VRRLRVTASSAGHSGGFGTRPGGTTAPARGARCKPGLIAPEEARPGAESPAKAGGESRSRAPKGAPAGVSGRPSPAIRRWVRSRDGPPGAAFRTSACRRSAPLTFSGSGK